MFTIYIHILEVLAMHPQGVSVKVIMDMGGELITTERNAKSYLRDLKTQGFVSYQDKDDLWFITEKTIEYCETVVRRHDLTRYVNIVENVHYMVSGDYVLSIDEDGVPDHNYIGLVKDTGELPSDALPEKNAPKSHHDAITGDLKPPSPAKLSKKDEYAEIALLPEYDPVKVQEYRSGAYGSPDDWEFEICDDCGEMMRDCGCYDLCEDCGHMQKDCWC